MSEYGGEPHIIQPGIEGVPEAAAAAGLGHESVDERAADRRGVRDHAMVIRRAGLKHAQGVPAETIIDPTTGVATFIPYDEERARTDLITGNND